MKLVGTEALEILISQRCVQLATMWTSAASVSDRSSGVEALSEHTLLVHRAKVVELLGQRQIEFERALQFGLMMSLHGLQIFNSECIHNVTDSELVFLRPPLILA